MKIACLGWGSLIWRPESLLIRREWFSDGPLLPIEFVRQSNDGRLTLVITDTAKPIRTLWALMATGNLQIAMESLRIREGIGKNKRDSHIATVSKDTETENPCNLTIQNWLRACNLDAAIWTNLPPRFKGEDNKEPALNEAIKYLQELDINTKANAEQYIRRAPRQIDTDFRRAFESAFGWTFVNH